jgi:hypothetical protein
LFDRANGPPDQRLSVPASGVRIRGTRRPSWSSIRTTRTRPCSAVSAINSSLRASHRRCSRCRIMIAYSRTAATSAAKLSDSGSSGMPVIVRVCAGKHHPADSPGPVPGRRGVTATRLADQRSVPIDAASLHSVNWSISQAGHQLVDYPMERLECHLDRLHGCQPQAEAGTTWRVSRRYPSAVHLAQAHLNPERRATQPEGLHAGGIPRSPCTPPCIGDPLRRIWRSSARLSRWCAACFPRDE